MKSLDTQGLLCPKPLISLKEALKDMDEGERIQILTDNDTSHKNLIRFLLDQGVDPKVTKQGKVYTITSDVPSRDISDVNPDNYCTRDNSSNDYVICIRKNRMGEGDPELGRILLETFINNLNQQESLPTHLVFYNEGVKLTKKDSPVIETLMDLEKAGTRVIVCGTCIDFYGIQNDIGAGMISNMVVITETLVNAGHVIYP
jgi:selenium metabolism protein YedF